MKFLVCFIAVLAIASAAEKKDKRGLLDFNYGYNGLAGWNGLDSAWTGSLGGLALDGGINAYSSPLFSSEYAAPVLSKSVISTPVVSKNVVSRPVVSKTISAAPIDARIAAPISYSAPISDTLVKSYGAPIVSGGLRSYSAPIAASAVKSYEGPMVSSGLKSYSGPLVSKSSPVVGKSYDAAVPLGLSGYSGLSDFSGLSEFSGLSGVSGLSLGQEWGSDLSLGHGLSSW